MNFVTAAMLGASAAHAQDSASARRPDDSIVGSARVGLSVLYLKPDHTALTASGVALSFIARHWQAGLAPSISYVTTPANQSFFSGSLAALVNYLPLENEGEGWQPYIGVYGAESGQSNATGYGILGAQAGWLRFFSPSVALRAETRLRHFFFRNDALTYGDVLLTLDPYLFGRASRSLTTLPSLGVFDLSMLADFQYRPGHTLELDGLFAPFVTSWLQVGASADIQFDFSINASNRSVEAFARGYLPLSVRAVPFADLFAGEGTQGTFESESVGNHGARAGVRTYLTPGVALDVAIEWRDFALEPIGAEVFQQPESRTIRATLITQFRARIVGRD